MKNIMLSVSVIIGTLIGAGFASGKEIEIFFCEYGIYGMIGILFAASLIGVIIYWVFQISSKNHINTYNQFLEFVMKNPKILQSENKRNEWVKSVIKNTVNLFLLISFFIMVAGFGSYFYQEFQISPIFGAILLVILCYMTFNKGIKGITQISSVLVPLLICFIFVLGLQEEIYFPIENNIFMQESSLWIISAILYGSYNTILVIPILFPLKKYITNNKTMKKICAISVFIMILLATIIYAILIKDYQVIQDKEIPMLYIVGKEKVFYKFLYGILILVSIYTSAISAGYGFLQNTVKKCHQKKANMAICIIAIFISNFGFSSLVNLLYPILGGIGLFQIYRILKCLKST